MSNDPNGEFANHADADLAIANPGPDSPTATTIPIHREVKYERPGFIAWATSHGSYSGCRAMTFGSTQEMNEFFKGTAGLLVCHLEALADGGYLVLYTNTLEGDALDEFNEFSRAMELHMREWRDKRAEAKRKEEEAVVSEHAEIMRLYKLGKTCEEHHASLVKEKRAAKKAKRK